MTITLISMYLVSAALPLWGLISLYFTAKRAAAHGPSLDTVRLGDITNLLKGTARSIVDRPQRVLRDLGLIGGGLILSTTASILSLFI